MAREWPIEGGAATKAVQTSGRKLMGGAAIPIAILTDDDPRPTIAGAALPLQIVEEGDRPMMGGAALPVRIVEPSAGPVMAGAAMPAVVVEGSLPGAGYRKQIPITGQAGAGTDYQVRLEVYSGSGTDSDGVVYLEGHSADFPNDVHFTDDDGETELDFWLDETAPEDDFAIFWIEIRDNLNTNQNFYIYYGESAPGTASDIANTFIFGDDLEQDVVGNDPSKWAIVQGTLSTLKVSADTGYWTSEESLGLNISAAWVAPDGTIWAGHKTDGTIRKSTDGGATWTTKYTFGVGAGGIRCVWVASNGYIYASRDNSGILVRSTDGGEIWATCLTLSDNDESMVWYMDEDSAGNLYAGEYSSGAISAAYIYKSITNGASWTTIWNNPDSARHIHIVRVDPYTDYIYASQGDDIGDRKLIRSTTAGSSWDTLGSGAAWAFTSIEFGDGFRLLGEDFLPSSKIKKTVDDTVFTTAYTPPAADDNVFWAWASKSSDGAIFFGSWTQANNERATIVGTWNEGGTWAVLEAAPTGVGNRGFGGASNFDASNYLYHEESVAADGRKRAFRRHTDNNIKAISPDATQATGEKTITFLDPFVVEHQSMVVEPDVVLTPLYVRDGAIDRVNVAFWSDGLIKYHNGVDWQSTGRTYLPTLYYDFRYVVYLSLGVWDLHIDNIGYSQLAIPFRNAGFTADRLWIGTGAGWLDDNYYDIFRLRKYNVPEPIVGTAGAEEEV